MTDMTNLDRVQALVSSGRLGCDALMITDEISRRFCSGFASSAGVMLITPPKSLYLTDFRYIEAASAAMPDTAVKMVSRGEKYADYLNDFISENSIARLGCEDTRLTLAEYNAYDDLLAAELVPMGNALMYLRAEKQDFELDCMKKAQEITDRAFDSVLGAIKEGMTEKELCAELIYRLYKFGADNLSFDPIVVSGANGSKPHGVPGHRKLGKGDFITMDFGVIYGGYCSDMTRTVALGRVGDEMKKVYQIVLDAQKIGLENARAGLKWIDVDGMARSYISERGYGECFGHGLGHGLGLEIHEPLDFDPERPGVTPENGVVSVEPGIYIPGRFGVRIEDCVILKNGGNIDLTGSPKQLIEL